MKLSIFDMHCDTPDAIYHRKASIASNDLHLSLEGMKNYDHYIQVMAVFIPPRLNDTEGFEFWKNATAYLDAQIEENKDIIIKATDGLTCINACNNGLYAAIYSIEDARIVGDDLSRIDKFYSAGVRFITLTWSGNSVIGGSFNTDNGITPFGRQALKKMFEVGIIPDISHSSEQLADDVCEAAIQLNKPFVATHSNSFYIWGHRRNLRDRHFEVIKQLGGLVGISFCRPHIADETKCTITLSALIPHIEHYLSLGGENTVALGSDFDGTDLPDDLSGCADLYSLANELARLNYTQQMIDKIFFLNGRNFIEKNII